MMLVEESLRGRGLGRALMQHALAYLDERGVERVRLDATPLGRPLYEKLGFVAEIDLHPYEGGPTGTGEPATGELGAGVGRLDRVRRFDAEVTGADRSALLGQLYRKRSRFRVVERGECVEGYASFRPGARAWYLGPCLATAAAGPLLMAWAFYWTAQVPV